jgi:molybdopterin molybdotransferase
MSQLASDLEAFGEPMRSVEEAANHIAGTLAPVADVETVPLAQADARVLAYDLIASLALPLLQIPPSTGTRFGSLIS